MKGFHLRTLCFGMFACLWLAIDCFSGFSAPPANDMFSDRIVVEKLPSTFSGDASEATLEPGEPVENVALSTSVWWTWTAPTSGVVGVNFPVPIRSKRTLRVYTGDSVENLTPVPLHLAPTPVGFREIPWGHVYWSFLSEAGTTYHLAAYNAGLYSLEWLERPANDFVERPQVIPAEGGVVTGTTTNATLGPDEPDLPGSQPCVWFSWTPDFSGEAFLMLKGGTGSDPFVVRSLDGAWSETSSTGVNAFLPVAVIQGQTYLIRVSGRPGAFRFAARSSLHNDNFVDATAIIGNSSVLDSTTWGTTIEPGEPFTSGETGPNGTAWWRWVAPTNGLLRIKAGNSLAWTLYRLFTGTSLNNLRLLSSRYGNVGTGYPDYFHVAKGRTYYIRAEDSTFVYLEMELFDRPPNDNFERRAVLTGYSATASEDNFLATRQKNEPQHGGMRGAHSVWWTWQAPLSGHLFINSIGSDFQNIIAAYEGDSLRSLELQGDNRLVYWTGVLGIPVEAGRNYQIAVDSIVNVDEKGRARRNPGRIALGLDFTTLRIVNVTNGTTFVGPTNVSLQLNEPMIEVDGHISSAQYYMAMSPYLVQPAGMADSAPFFITLSNLNPGIHVYGAAATNSQGQVRTVPPVSFIVRPSNDNFADAIPLLPVPGIVSGWVAGTSWEPREKRPRNPGPTLGSSWWRWTPAEDGPFRLQSSSDAVITLFRGRALGSLRQVAKVIGTAATFQANASDSYYIQAYSTGDQPFAIAPHIQFTLEPAN